MVKFIYISNAADDAAAYPIDALKGIDTAAGKVHMYFKPHRIGDAVATGDTNDHIVLSCGADEKASLKYIAEAIASPTGDELLVVADDENSVYLADSGITAVDSITYAT